MWRGRLYGSGRDMNLVERLGEYENLEQLLTRAKASGKADYHEGFNRHGTSAKPVKRDLLHEIPFLPTDTAQKWRCLIKQSSELLRPYGIKEGRKDETDLVREWPSDADKLFFGPRVVLHHTPVKRPAFIQAAYTDVDFSFHKEIHAIYSESFSTNFLKFIAAVLSSRLAFYFLFQTSLSWGIESIPQLRNVDILNVPLPDFRNDADKSKIIDEVASRMDFVENSAPTAELEREINMLVFSYYDLNKWEQDLVEDTVATVAPAALSDIALPWPVAAMKSDAQHYLIRLSEALSEWLNGREVTGKAYVSGTAGTGLVLLSRLGEGDRTEVLTADHKLEQALSDLREALSLSHKTALAQDVLLFEEDNLYLTKAMVRRNWTRSAALNDADHIISALIRARRH
jgi:hypothetical protein